MIQFTETVLRDAQQSLLATRMPYSKFEEILPVIDQAGYYSAEMWGGATFDVCLRFLGEDPWERLRKIRKAMPNTKLQMLLRGQNILGYAHYPNDVVRRFVRAAVRNGIDIIRIFDALNDVDNLRVAIEETVEWGLTRPAPSPIPQARSTPVRPTSSSRRKWRPWALRPSASRIWRAL